MNKIFINKKGNATLVMVMIPTGSYYEDNKVKGISHFLEHFCFKGTNKRTRKDIENAIEGVGGDLNAFTDTEITCYHATVANKYKDIAIDVITDLAVNPIFPAKEIDKEREVIIQELKMYKDSPSSAVYDLYNQFFYPEESGFHYPIIGTEKSLHNIGRKELIEYHKEKYNTPTLIVIGDVPTSGILRYSGFKTTNSTIYTPKKQEYFEKRKIEQAHILMGNDVNLYQYSYQDKVLLLDLLNLLFNGMSGRLFNEIREKNNLVYRIKFDYILWSGGMITWYISLGLEKDKISKAHKLIEKEMLKSITKKELENTIIKTVGTHALEIENIDTLANVVAYSIRKQVNWQDLCFNYEKEIRRVGGKLNEFLKLMNFKHNFMAGIVPKV